MLHIRCTCQLHRIGNKLCAFLPRQFFQLCSKCKIFCHSHFRVDRRNLRQITDTFPCFFRLIQNTVIVYAYFTGGRCNIPRHYVHCCGFSGPVWTEESVDLSFFYGKRKVIDCGLVAVSLNKMCDFNQASLLLVKSSVPGQ